LFESGKPIKEVAQELMKSENQYVRHLAEFIINSNSKRGIPYDRKV